MVLACNPLCHDHVGIELAVTAFPSSNPGQFLQLRCCDSDAAATEELDWPPDGLPSLTGADIKDKAAYLPRPFSIADHWMAVDGMTRLYVISHAVGPGTRWLSELQPGDGLTVTGPLGRGFRLPPTGTPIVLIGGGVGIPPLLYLARRLHEGGYTDVTAVFGARRRELLPLRLVNEPATDGTPTACVELPGPAEYPAIITSDDGSIGTRGFVTDALLAHHDRSRQRSMVFACGPEAMLRAVADLTRDLDLPCQLCIERNMGCGMGTCQSCVVRARDAGRSTGWRWALACQDGPVFERDELLDYDPAPSA